MKRLAVFVAVITGLGLLATTNAAGDDRAVQVLNRFLDLSGGVEKIGQLPGLTAAVQIDAYNYGYTLHLHPDGRFQAIEPNRTTVYDGDHYWQSAYGLVDRLPEARVEEYSRYSMNRFCFHDLITPAGKPATLQYRVSETEHGQTYDLLETPAGEQRKRTYYFNTGTGLLDKVVEVAPDPVLRERKNVYRYSEYASVGGIQLFTKSEGACISDGTVLDPTSRYVYSLPEAPDVGLFTKPESTAPPATFENGAFVGKVIGISGGGSLITNLNQSDVDQLGIIDGSLMAVIARGQQTEHLYISNLDSATNVGQGDYIAAFNNTPALWIVKAYVGMTSDKEFAVGDTVRVSKVTQP